MSAHYQDYVIKEGRFIGAFEEMYRDCPDPWHQDAIQPLSEDAALLLVKRGSYSNILDLGCGKGRFTGRLCRETGSSVTAVDLSPTAISAARSRFPQIDFQAASVPPLPFPNEGFDLVVTAELLWYVLPKLKELFVEIRRVLKPGGHYLILQHFYRPDEQRYGREVLQTPEDLLNLLPFSVVHHLEMDPAVNHKLVLLLKR